MTKEVSFAVEFIACLSSDQVRRRLISARISAPVAPMAPPSVGVAMPRKIVPSTRKISASGGISTNITRRSSLKPRSVRASGGSAGADCGMQHGPAEHVQHVEAGQGPSPGMIAPAYMSPTERPSWSASTISTSDGGMICASVPDAAMTPRASRRS